MSNQLPNFTIRQISGIYCLFFDFAENRTLLVQESSSLDLISAHLAVRNADFNFPVYSEISLPSDFGKFDFSSLERALPVQSRFVN